MVKDSERVRSFGPKSKNGCITCKAKRIKCDETLPECVRCTQSRRVCGGYTRIRFPLRRNKHNITLAPKPESSASPVFSVVRDDYFANDQEYHYFTLFSESLASEIAPGFNSQQWRLLILQSCETVPGIRHTAIAIAALAKASEACRASHIQRGHILGYLPRSGSGFRPPSHSHAAISEYMAEATQHHNFALNQYQKAIKAMRNSIVEGRHDIRTALLTCIVIACFESLHGNPEGSADQVSIGLRLLKEWKQSCRKQERFVLGMTSPEEGTVEGFLCQAFGHMETQIMTYRDLRTPEEHYELLDEGKEAIKNMPGSFDSVGHAGIYSDLIIRRALHFSASSGITSRELRKAQQGPDGNHDTTTPAPSQNFARFFHGFKPLTTSSFFHGATPSQSLSHPNLNIGESRDIIAEAAEYDKAFDDWLRNFSNTLASALKTGGATAIAALTLAVNMNGAKFFRAVTFKSEMDYDIFLPQFREIVRYASLLQRIRGDRKNASNSELEFSFEQGITIVLQLVAVKCRYGPIRREAVRLLARHQKREGMMDSYYFAVYSRWVVELEGQLEEREEESKAGWILPARRRVTKLRGSPRWMERKGEISCFQMAGEGVEERWVERKGEFSW